MYIPHGAMVAAILALQIPYEIGDYRIIINVKNSIEELVSAEEKGMIDEKSTKSFE